MTSVHPATEYEGTDFRDGFRAGYDDALDMVLNTAEVYFATDMATRNLLAGLIKRVREQA